MSKIQRGGVRSWLKSIMFRYIYGMVTCKEFDDFLQAYIEGDLPTRQRSVFDLHLRFCRECRDYLAAYKRAMEVGYSILAAPEDPVPGDVPEDLIQAILAARKQ